MRDTNSKFASLQSKIWEVPWVSVAFYWSLLPQ